MHITMISEIASWWIFRSDEAIAEIFRFAMPDSGSNGCCVCDIFLMILGFSTLLLTLVSATAFPAPGDKYFGRSDAGDEARAVCAKITVDGVEVHAMVQRVVFENVYKVRFVTHWNHGDFRKVRRSGFETYTTGVQQRNGQWSPAGSEGAVRSRKHIFKDVWYELQWDAKAKRSYSSPRSGEAESRLLVALFPLDLGLESGNYGAHAFDFPAHRAFILDREWEIAQKTQFGISDMNLLNGEPVNFFPATCNQIMQDIIAVDALERRMDGQVFSFTQLIEPPVSWKIVSGSRVQSVATGAFIPADFRVTSLPSGARQIHIAANENDRRYSRVFDA